MTGLDTDVLLHFLIQDETQRTTMATRFIEANCTDRAPCWISLIVLCELAWVMKRAYGMDRSEIHNVLETILHIRQFCVAESDILQRALNEVRLKQVDFADALIGRLNLEAGCDRTVTFDHRISGRLSTFRRLENPSS